MRTVNRSPITFCPEDAMFLARALKELAAAQKTDTDRTLAIQRETAKSAANKAEEAMKSRGMSGETVDFIKNAVLGVAA